ncbi:hypothetical protein [Streptomyces sp. NPDC003077]|uniref:hypothetical protein n=1 Tax=Streptomyces sp. NPDC003077 TaxID=3154443 RepID=UPI0033A0AAF9
MGKRQRRRERQRSGGTGKQQRTPVVVRFPSLGTPLVRVEIDGDAPPDVRETCLAYWEFDEAGTWARPVSDIGSAKAVCRTVQAASTASLLTVVCPGCAGPVTVSTRSEMAASGYWRAGGLPATVTPGRAPCEDCRAAADTVRREEEALAEELRRQAERRRADNIVLWLDAHRDDPAPTETPSLQAALVLLSAAETMERTADGTFGPLSALSSPLTGSESGDADAIGELYRKGWIAPAPPVAAESLTYEDDDTVSGFYPDELTWRPAHALGENALDAREAAITRLTPHLLRDIADVRAHLADLDAGLLTAYLSGLLTRQYGEAPVPEHRLTDLHAAAREALDDGFSLGQLIAIAWSAASGAVSWGQRTPGLKPGSVSAAAVTNFGRGIGYAKDRPATEYDIPGWLPRPAVRATALSFLEQYGDGADPVGSVLSL